MRDNTMTVVWDGTNEVEIQARLSQTFPEVNVKPDGHGLLRLSYRRGGLRVTKTLRQGERYTYRRMTALEAVEQRDRQRSPSEQLTALAMSHPVVHRVLAAHARKPMEYPDLLETIIHGLADENDALRDELTRRALYSEPLSHGPE